MGYETTEIGSQIPDLKVLKLMSNESDGLHTIFQVSVLVLKVL